MQYLRRYLKGSLCLVLLLGLCCLTGPAPVTAAGDGPLVWSTEGVVSPTKNWTVRFNQAINPAAVTRDNFQVLDNGVPVTGVTVQPGTDGTTVVVKAPPGGYLPGREYRLTISRQVQGGAGAVMQQDVVMPFTVQATPGQGAATLTHAGFDFSTNTFLTLEDQLPDNGFLDRMDGIIVTWDPYGPWTENSGNLWLWTHVNADCNRVADLGPVSLDTVTDLTGVTFPALTPPLVAGHVYLAQCRDGYVKFKVQTIDTGQFVAGVEWMFSATGTF